jgi:hypothetical protein
VVAGGVEDLTSTWLAWALDAEIRSVTAEPIGTGQTGASFRLRLDTECGRSTVVAKLARGDAAARRRVANGYRREVGFYTQLASTLDVRAPRCWYGAVADDALLFTLLLEDLAPRVPGRQSEGATIAQAEPAVRNLARLHASRWNDDTLFDLTFVPRDGEATATFLGGLAISATRKFLARYEAELDAKDMATLEEASRAVSTWLLARPRPFAVVHGDYRLDNLMFPPEGDDVVAVDWQTLTIGPPLRDLSYFLGTSLAAAERRAAEESLLGIYHAGLVERGVHDYDLERCFADYRLGHLQGPMITVIGWMYATSERSDESDRMFLAMARRSCDAIRDHDSIGAL